MAAKKKSDTKSTQSVIARSDDGTIQITYTIPYGEIQKAQIEVANELGKDIEIPGFRKGKAPVDKVIASLSQSTLLEKTLSKILPKLFADTVEKENIKPAIYPKFELVKANADEDWQVRATTCELPTIKLGDYKQSLVTLARGKKEIAAKAQAKAIWTPSSAKAMEGMQAKVPTREEKEQEVIKTLLETAKLTIPKILIDEEVNTRLSRLLQRIEKLGLSLETYLASIRKTAESIRSEYEKQAAEAISLDLILTQVANTENIKVDQKEVDTAVGAAAADKDLVKEFDTPDRRKFIEVILKRRKALDSLTTLI